jgi:photosystem II stability/assembly factor-like uncharacterized protein
MIRIVFRVLVLCVCVTGIQASTSFAKSENGPVGWASQDSGTTNHLYAVFFLDPDTGFAVGAAGTILKSTDGGATWTPLDSGTSNGLGALNFIDTNTGWVFGGGGTVLHTTDGGASWTLQAGPASSAVSFVDDHTGWAANGGSILFHTTDSGATWSQQRLPGTHAFFSGVAFQDQNNGVAVGYDEPTLTSRHSTIVRTTDGGDDWSERAGLLHSFFDAVAFGDAYTAIAVGGSFDFGGFIFYSWDAGESWSLGFIDAPRLDSLIAVACGDDANAWALGHNGTILRTKDGGATWALQSTGTSNELSGIFFVDAYNGWAVGENGLILHTTTGGE